MFEGQTPKTAPDLEAVSEQEKLPALLQFSLDLKTNKEKELLVIPVLIITLLTLPFPREQAGR